MSKTAKLYRMVTSQHICPFGLRSKDLLEREGFEVEDHQLSSREETDAFKQQYDVETTPQTFIDGKRVGGYDDLREYFGKDEAAPDRYYLHAGHYHFFGSSINDRRLAVCHGQQPAEFIVITIVYCCQHVFSCSAKTAGFIQLYPIFYYL